ncbi:hypothetical protein ACLBXM_02145 [Xanthobacteraceae bacterium A53D]
MRADLLSGHSPARSAFSRSAVRFGLIGGAAIVWLALAPPIGGPVAHAAEGTSKAPCSTQGAEAPKPAETPINRGADSGTQPGTTGNTGWTNGNGGSFVGTSNQGPSTGSTTQHPEVVKGVDPKADQSRSC